MDVEPEIFGGINEIRDRALMLSFGNEYLCKETFLKKMGIIIAQNVRELKEDINSLKVRLPGDVQRETNEILNGIHRLASRMLNPDFTISQKCSMGELGRELEISINSLAHVVKTVEVEEEGDQLDYSKTEAISVPVETTLPVYVKAGFVPRFFGWIDNLGHLITALFIFIIRSFIFLILISILPFTYLLVTMESEKDLLSEVNKNKTFIQIQKEILLKWDDEKEQHSKKLESMIQKDPNRQEKIEIMDLNLIIHQLDEERYKTEFEIDTYERKIESIDEKLGMIKRKSFLEKLLRL